MYNKVQKICILLFYRIFSFFLYRSRIPDVLNAYAGGSAVPLQSDAILFLEA